MTHGNDTVVIVSVFFFTFCRVRDPGRVQQAIIHLADFILDSDSAGLYRGELKLKLRR